MTKPYDLAIAMATYFDPHYKVPAGYRRKLYDECIESLQKAKWFPIDSSKVILTINDDNSTEPPSIPTLPIAVEAIAHKVKGEQCFDNIWRALMRAKELGRWVINLDSDSLVKPHWISEAFRLVHAFPYHKAYGLFNTKYHETIENCDWYVKKKSLTELGMMFRADDLPSRRTSLLESLYGNAWPEFHPCLRPSVVQHTGMIGVNNPQGDDFDPEF